MDLSILLALVGLFLAVGYTIRSILITDTVLSEKREHLATMKKLTASMERETALLRENRKLETENQELSEELEGYYEADAQILETITGQKLK